MCKQVLKDTPLLLEGFPFNTETPRLHIFKMERMINE